MRERSTGVKRGHTKVYETDSSQSSLDKLGINASQLTASCFTLDAFNFFFNNYWAACAPSHKMGFQSSVSKSGLPGERRHEGLVPRNDVLTNGFI